MTVAIIAVTLFGLCAIAAMLYAMSVMDENEQLRATIRDYIEIINDLILEDE